MAKNEGENGFGELVLAAMAAGGKALAGVPPSLIANTVKVLGRLAGSASSIPAAWIDSKAQKIKDETAARSAIVKAVSRAAAKEAAGDPAFVSGALETWAGDLVIRESNKRMVAHATIEEVAHQTDASDEATDTADVGEIDDDWINVFSQFVENASTARMQRLWARVAAGEARKPGMFSLSTLRAVSELDKQTADDFTEMAGYFVGDVVFPNEEWHRGRLFTLSMRMHGRGLFLGREGDASRFINLDADGNGHSVFQARSGGYGIILEGTPHIEKAIPVILLSTEALELAQLLPAGSPWQHLKTAAEAIDKSGLTTAQIVQLDAGNCVTHRETIWTKPLEAPAIVSDS